MSRIWILARNDLRLTVRDRMAFVWMLVLPIAMMWFIGNVGGSSGDGRISLAVVNEDAGWISAALIEELSDEQIHLRELTAEEAQTDENKVRTLVFPAGFTDGVLAGEQQELRLEKESGSNQEFGLAAQVHITRAIVRTLGRLVEMQGAGSLSAAAEATDAFRALGERPALVTLDVSTAGKGTAVPEGFAQSVPGMLTFIVLMMTMIYGGVFLTVEKQSGMLRRQSFQPISRRSLLLGKLAGRLLLAGLQIIALVLAGRFLFGVSWGDSPAGLALVLLSYAVAVAGMSTLLGAVSRTPAQASSIGWIGAMILASLGGCWWPSEVMPRWIWTAAHALPTAWAMDAFHALISFGRGLDAVLLPSAVLLAFGVASSFLGARLLRFE